MTTRPDLVDLALARVSLEPRPYSEHEVEAAEARVAARVTRQMVSGALSFDDEIRSVRREALPPPPRPPQRCACRTERARELELLCRTLVEREGALQHMSAFLGRRIPQPDGARVLGCVLQLAGREDSARFWWQFAAGAGDAAAAYCLYLHHLTLGEVWEAELWRKQAAPRRGAPEPEDVPPAPDGEQVEDGSSPALVLRVLSRLRGDGDCLTATATAVLHYVPYAVHFVDEIELPLPVADFAERIEELTGLA